jgi:CBS domain-containing protein
MHTVRQMLQAKPAIHSVSPDDTVFDALQIMAERNIGAVLVIEHGELVGILSERDYARKGILKGHHSKDTPVRALMTTPVVSVPASWSVHHCMSIMTERRIRHLPVVDGGRLIGVISIGDVVRAVVDDQQFTINALQSYIASA